MIGARLGSRLWWGLAPLLVLLVGTGALATRTMPGIPVPPLVTQVAAPVAGYAQDISLALTLGCLTTLLWSNRGQVRRWAVGWIVIGLGAIVGGAVALQSDITTGRLGIDAPGLLTTLQGTAVGWAIAIQTGCLLLALVLTCLGGAIRAPWATWGAMILTGVCIGAPAVAGHAGLSGEHQVAGVSTGLHAVAIALWVGGLAVVSTRCLLDPGLAQVLLPRFSLLALICVITAAETGLLSASLTVGTLGDLVGSTYGSLIIAKATLLAWLVWLGWQQRRRALDRLPDASVPATVGRIAGIELLLMACAISAAVVMVRIGPPPIPVDGIAPLTLIALGIGLPMLIGLLRPTRLRIVTDWPEATMVVFLVVVVETGGVGLLRTTLGSLGLIVELAGLLLLGWLASCAARRSGAAVVVGMVGLPLAMLANGLLNSADSWRMTLVAALIGEGLFTLAWLMGRRRNSMVPRMDQAVAS